MIDKHLILHAGTHKTGTTAIQDSLQIHAAFLAERDYCPAVLHRDLRDLHRAFNPKAYGLQAADLDLHALRRDFRHWASQASAGNIIISGEAISHPFWENWGQDEAVGPFLFSGFARQTLVLYVRRQDRFIESAYQELLKHGLAETFAEYCSSPAGDMRRILDWHAKLANLAALYPEAKMILRLFDRVREKGDVFRDFLTSLGIPELPATIISSQENTSLSAAQMEMLRLCNLHRGREQRQILLQLFAKGAALPAISCPHRRFLDDGERAALIAEYHPANAMLFAEHGLGDGHALDQWERITAADRRQESQDRDTDEALSLSAIDRLCAEAVDAEGSDPDRS